jgi:hypothetical protein
MKRLILLAIPLALVLTLAGCGKPPETLVNQVTAALQAAEAAGAPQYAADAWNRAKQAVDQVKAALDAQAKRFSLFRNYGKVSTLGANALKLAQQALSEAEAKKKQLGGEVTSTIAEIASLLDSARSRLSKLPRIRGLDPAALRSQLNSADRLLGQARTQGADGAFDAALATAARAREAVTKVLRDIERATGGPASRKR